MKIYLDGLSRSGNIFLSYAVSSFFNNELLSERTHDLSSLKKYKNGSCFIVPVRDALPCLLSTVIYIDYAIDNKIFGAHLGLKDYIDALVIEQTNYLKYLVNNEHFFIAPFHEFTKDHVPLCNVIAAEYPQLNKKTKKTTKEDFLRDAENKNIHFYHSYLGSVPRKEVLHKKEIKQMLQNKYEKELTIMQEDINKLYERYYIIKNKHNL
jgi:hypothetical protein